MKKLAVTMLAMAAAPLFAATTRYVVTDGGGNIAVASVDAMKFADAANGDCRLAVNSPLRDNGVKLDWMTAEAKDLDGSPRVVSRYGIPLSADASALPDIGCYECRIPVPGFIMLIR